MSKNLGEAEKWLRKSAAQGYRGAYFSLGLLFEDTDKNEAIYWYKKHVDDWWKTYGELYESSIQKLRKLGVEYHPGRSSSSSSNNNDLASRLKLASDPDDPIDQTEQFKLGFRYYNGDGTAKDYSKAAYWFSKAAEQGLAEAQACLGICYYAGIGVSQDYSQAAYWFKKAAEQGDAKAQYNLGNCYEKGQGISQDCTQAAYWYKKAAEQGYAKAQLSLGTLYAIGNGVRKDKTQAIFWLEKAASGNERYKSQLDLIKSFPSSYWKE